MDAVKLFQVLEGHNSDVMGCDFFEDYLATCSGDKTIRVWCRKSEDKFDECDFSPLLDHTYGVNCVKFSPLGTFLASCSTDGRVILWKIQDGEKIAEMKHPKGSPLRTCSFAPTSAIFATGGDDEKIVLWDITTKSAVRTLEGHESMITALAFTPDSAFLLSCSTSGDTMLWDALYGHGKCLSSVKNAHDLGILGCDFSAQYEAISENGFMSGNYTLATCGNDDLVKIWSVETGSMKTISLLLKLSGHSGNVMSCYFSSDGALLASVGGDRMIFLWDPKTGRALQKLEGHNRYITCCAFSSNMLATGSNDRTVMLWAFSKENILKSSTQSTSLNSESFISIGGKTCFLSWTKEDVAKWLESLKLEKHINIFCTNSIDGKELAYLTHENLQAYLKIDSFGERNKILRQIQYLKNPLWQHVLPDLTDELMLNEFCCPITHEIMRNPVVAADGYTYEEKAIRGWLESGNNTSPMTNDTLSHKHLIPNHVLRQLIEKFQK